MRGGKRQPFATVVAAPTRITLALTYHSTTRFRGQQLTGNAMRRPNAAALVSAAPARAAAPACFRRGDF